MFRNLSGRLVYTAKNGKGTGNGIRGLIGPNAGKSRYAVRWSHTIPRGRKSQADTDSGLIDPNLSVWRSINAEHKEVEQVPTDQTENIMNYYKDRWIQEHKDRKQTETISGAEVTREEGSDGDRRSLYSQLAKRTTSAKPQHPGNMHSGGYNESGMMKPFDPYRMQKITGSPSPLSSVGHPHFSQDVEIKDMKSQLRHNETAPSFWEKSPYSKGIPAMSFEPSKPQSQDAQAAKARPLDPNVPYRPTFSVADMLGNKAEQSNKNERLDEPSEIKASKKLPGKETQKEPSAENTSPFQPSAPPLPDFKSS